MNRHDENTPLAPPSVLSPTPSLASPLPDAAQLPDRVFSAQGCQSRPARPMTFKPHVLVPYTWFISNLKRNKLMHALHGNTSITEFVSQMQEGEVDALMQALSARFECRPTHGFATLECRGGSVGAHHMVGGAKPTTRRASLRSRPPSLVALKYGFFGSSISKSRLRRPKTPDSWRSRRV